MSILFRVSLEFIEFVQLSFGLLRLNPELSQVVLNTSNTKGLSTLMVSSISQSRTNWYTDSIIWTKANIFVQENIGKP